MEYLFRYFDRQDTPLDTETCVSILMLQCLCHWFVFGTPGDWFVQHKLVFRPSHLKLLVHHFLEVAQQSKQFEAEWYLLSTMLSDITTAWETGSSWFQSDTDQDVVEREQRCIFPREEVVLRVARRRASAIYERDRSMQLWFTNGYLDAWKQHVCLRERNEERNDK